MKYTNKAQHPKIEHFHTIDRQTIPGVVILTPHRPGEMLKNEEIATVAFSGELARRRLHQLLDSLAHDWRL